jgi:hypothetical protein
VIDLWRGTPFNLPAQSRPSPSRQAMVRGQIINTAGAIHFMRAQTFADQRQSVEVINSLWS